MSLHQVKDHLKDLLTENLYRILFDIEELLGERVYKLLNLSCL